MPPKIIQTFISTITKPSIRPFHFAIEILENPKTQGDIIAQTPAITIIQFAVIFKFYPPEGRRSTCSGFQFLSTGVQIAPAAICRLYLGCGIFDDKKPSFRNLR